MDDNFRRDKLIETRQTWFSMIIAVVNQKGGVGKTTTTLNLGAALLAGGKTVQMLDLDDQKSLTFMAEGIESLPVRVADEGTLDGFLGAEKTDFVLLDCPPALGEATAAALKRAHLVIAPTPPRVLDLAGLSQLKATIEAARQRVNPTLKLRILLTLRDARITLQNDYESQLRRAFAGEMFQTVIPRAAVFERAADAHQTLLEFAPRSPGSEAFRLLAKEVTQLGGP